MSDAIEMQTVGEFVVKVIHDDSGCAENPRNFADGTTFFGFHPHYVSPDTAPDQDPQTARRHAESVNNICLPVWLYDHSGTCYRASDSNPFHCPWDSGLFGFIYISKETARKNYGVKRISAAKRAQIIKNLKAQVEEYSAWANGDVYGFVIEDADGETVESCWGVIGDSDYAMAEGVEAAKGIAT